MGQCGCSDTAPDFRFPGPDGVTYALQVYLSCDYCSTPAGIDLYRMDAEEVEMWLDGVPEAPFVPYSDSQPVSAQLAVPVLDPLKLAEVFAEHVAEGDDEDRRELVEEDLRQALPEAVRQTMEEWHRLPATSPPETAVEAPDGQIGGAVRRSWLQLTDDLTAERDGALDRVAELEQALHEVANVAATAPADEPATAVDSLAEIVRRAQLAIRDRWRVSAKRTEGDRG